MELLVLTTRGKKLRCKKLKAVSLHTLFAHAIKTSLTVLFLAICQSSKILFLRRKTSGTYWLTRCLANFYLFPIFVWTGRDIDFFFSEKYLLHLKNMVNFCKGHCCLIQQPYRGKYSQKMAMLCLACEEPHISTLNPSGMTLLERENMEIWIWK